MTFKFRIVILNHMTSKILIERNTIKKEGGVVILDIEEYKRKENLLKSLKKFENLTKWGRNFARKKKITQKQVLGND